MFIQGDCNNILKDTETDSIDLIVTDPPYGIEFMGKDWDKAVVPTETWKECYRVLKQGKLAFVMCSPRQDVLSRMIVNLQDAGFRTNYTSIYHTYASGFPKAANLKNGSYVGFQPKPAVEVILVVSKGKTLTWLDDCRIPYQSEDDLAESKPWSEKGHLGFGPLGGKQLSDGEGNNTNEKGRFPANLLCQDDILNDGRITKTVPGSFGNTDYRQYSINNGYRQQGNHKGKEKIKLFGDTGSYSRYFSLDQWWAKTFPFLIVPKPAKSEKGEFNVHPTVKSQKLMSYLITMGSREGDLVLDPFCGSGTTLLAAKLLKRNFVGIELNRDYYQTALDRLRD